MLFYSWYESLAMLAAAIAVDWLVGDPRRLTHPVVFIGRLIGFLERRLRGTAKPERESPAALRFKGAVLAFLTVGLVFAVMWLFVWISREIHPWLGYAVNIWFISATIAVKGLKDAALLVYKPLAGGNLPQARTCVGYIVGRDTDGLNEAEITRAAVETVAENTVDAVISPLVFALLGGAPLAMAYRASNTLDSMVGYKNDRYLHFGWASARWDDVLNWVPARLTGLLLALAALITPGLSSVRAVRSMAVFASRHPSPNSGIPESAVAGALGVELGGRNVYGGLVSERAKLGWPLRVLNRNDIVLTVDLLYKVSYFVLGGCICALVPVLL